MGTEITLRWQIAPFACEFHLDGGQGLLLLRAGAEIIARETVASARMAYERAADLVETLRRRDDHSDARRVRASWSPGAKSPTLHPDLRPHFSGPARPWYASPRGGLRGRKHGRAWVLVSASTRRHQRNRGERVRTAVCCCLDRSDPRAGGCWTKIAPRAQYSASDQVRDLQGRIKAGGCDVIGLAWATRAASAQESALLWEAKPQTLWRLKIDSQGPQWEKWGGASRERILADTPADGFTLGAYSQGKGRSATSTSAGGFVKQHAPGRSMPRCRRTAAPLRRPATLRHS